MSIRGPRLRWGYVRALVVVLAAALMVAGPGVAAGSESGASQPPAGEASQDTYTNPVGASAGDDLPDPSVIRGRDGYWYAYATNTLMREGSDEAHRLPIVRSKDLVSWEYVGDVFNEDNWPSWLGPDSGVWGPAVKYWNGKYRLYFSGVNAPGHERPNRTIGVATAPTPAGPWTDSGKILVGPNWYIREPDERSFQATVGAHALATPEGERYLYYGAYKGGMWGVRLTGDGLDTVGEPTRISGEMHLEGAYVVHRDGWYYLFASSDGCCTGPVSGYRGYVARSKNPLGPFVDRNGVPIDALRPGGTPMIGATGNSWVGTGANSMVTDLSGQDWLAYHAVDRDQPYLNGPFQGGTRRGLLIDRLDWIEGWPIVRGGKGASDEPVPAPASDGLVADAFESGDAIGRQWQQDTTGWQISQEPAGGFVRAEGAGGERMLSARRALPPDVRIRGAVRLPGDGDVAGAAGFVLNDRGEADSVRVYLDASEGALVVEARPPGRDQTRVVEPLPESFAFGSWHDLAVEVRDGSMRVEATDAGLNDPLAIAETALPEGLVGGRFGMLARGAAADFDDVTAARLYQPHTEVVPDPEVGSVDEAFSDEFDGDSLGSQWSWVRGPAAGAEVADGALKYPVVRGNITRHNPNTPPLLLRDAPAGEEWTLQTEVDLSLGDKALHGFPMAGMLVYVDDDRYVRIAEAGHTDVRYTRLNREIPYAGRVLYGTSWTGPPGETTTWLRLRCSIDPDTGEQRLRGASSTDGQHWTWGAVYTMPADQKFRVGLMTGGASGQDPDFTARFDYLRLYMP